MPRQQVTPRNALPLPCTSIPTAVHVCIFAFDLLHRDGASLMHLPLEQRREQLLLALPNMRPGRCALAQSVRFPEAGAATSPLAAGSSVQLPGPGDQHEEAGGSADDTRGGTLMEIEGRIGAHGQEAAPLEERLQEMLLQAFAAGAGAAQTSAVLRLGCRCLPHASCLAAPPSICRPA